MRIHVFLERTYHKISHFNIVLAILLVILAPGSCVFASRHYTRKVEVSDLFMMLRSHLLQTVEKSIHWF